ncbi:MAG: HAD family phosphatase [Ruminococcus sp.]|jgi:Cof subfamily protein (haloacid dehalogenase superfamily)|nr:HAD family phosphatase [Ruminococcus sp.]
MDKKIVFLDIDGTLVNSEKKITKATKDSLMRIQKAGVKLAIASGRPSKGVIPYAEELELEKYAGYILPFNGGNIINYQTKEVVYSNTLSMDVLKKAYELSKEYGLELITYRGDVILSETDDNPYLLIESTINKMDVEKVDCVYDAVVEPPVKCLLLGDGDYLGKIENEIREKIGENANVFRSEPFFMEVVPQGIDKAAAIAALIKKIGIEREETIAFGDGFNDVSMVEYAGLGVAMSNGCDKIKEVADRIAPDNNSDGIAVVIDDVFGV